MADFTDMLDIEDDAKKRKSQLIKRELERRSHDKILIHNPTDEDYILVYDGYNHPIPDKNKDIGQGKGNRVVERYLAERYLKHMADKILQKRIDKEVGKELDRRKKQGQPEMTVFEKNIVINGIVGRMGRTSDPKNRSEVMKSLYLGVQEKFGRDEVPADRKVADKPVQTSEFDFMLEADRGTTNIEELVKDVPAEVTKEEALAGVEA